MVFMAVIALGDIIGVFFTGTMKFIVFFAYLAVIMYMFSKECRTWYNVG